ncbi:MAG: DUF47 domain-containing protein [Candidatus Bathyarchaeia archaeon]
MSERLVSWLDKRRRMKSIELIQRHLSATSSAVEELHKAIEYKINGDIEASGEAVNHVAELEAEADHLRNEISLDVAKSPLPASDREDLLRLIRRVDWIADWAREAARILVWTPLDKIPEGLTDLMTAMMVKVRECVLNVEKCVNRLGVDLEEALKIADMVERLEEEVDERYLEARGKYPTLDYSRINPGEAILISQLLDAIEYIADWSENTIDQVRIIAIRIS